MRHLQQVLNSGRWAISGPWTGQQSWNEIFCRRFADYVGTKFCCAVDHGSSALLVALLALDIGPGDEVIVPGLTWVACASSVLRAGARPVLVDVSPDTLCLDPAAVAAAITPRTRAILVVHLYSCMADMTALGAIAAGHGLPIIEDCAQAHGAQWQGRRAGSLGIIGVFSMQQGKVLTAGEGGAVVTDDAVLADRIERLHCDGRRLTTAPFLVGRPALQEVAGLQGMNLCLSEFQAALLCDGLDRLEAQTAQRVRAARLLDDALEQHPLLEPLLPHADNNRRAYYHYGIRLRTPVIARVPAERICAALSAELGTWVHGPYVPLNRHPLLAPGSLRALPAEVAGRNIALPVAEDQARRSILLHHPLLLSGDAGLRAIIDAFCKVFDHLDDLERLSDD
ncbi:DegT/DnrJ/EryC1/StrS family aminotransferase [Xanthobacteraceae bacterium A53D]